jgi:hypothetical protein
MANSFTYRADPPAVLSGSPAELAKAQADAGVAAASLGRIATPAELRAELALLRAATALPLKVALPSGLDASAGADMEALIEGGARIVEIDGRGLAPRKPAARSDGALLKALSRPEGLATAVHLGSLSRWSDEGLAILVADLHADRYVFDVAEGDSFGALAGLGDGHIAVLGLIGRDAARDKDAILARLDAAAEVLDSDRLALTIAGDKAGGMQQAAALRQLADVSTMFWGFAM